MQKIWVLAKTYLAISFRSPIMLIMAFVMPLIFTAVLGAAFIDSGSSDSRIPVLLIDEDGGSVAQQVSVALAESTVLRVLAEPIDGALPADRESALAEIVEYSWVIILPAGFSDTLLSGEKSSAELHIASSNEKAMAVNQEIQAVLSQVGSAIKIAQSATEQASQVQPFDSPQDEQAYFEQALAQAQQSISNSGIGVVSQKAYSSAGTVQEAAQEAAQEADGANQSSPGNLVTFGMVTLLASAIVLVDERTMGTLRRLVASPMTKGTLLAGKTLGPLLTGIVQMTVLIVFGAIIFGVAWGRSPLALVIMVLAFDLAAVSMGIFLSTVVATESQATGAMIGVSMATAALGGAWWPAEIMPSAMQTIGHLFPPAWAMDGFQAIILRGAGVQEILLPAAVLLGFAVLYFSLGVWRFRYE